MSDERLRKLERRWKESGSDEDEAAWLVERVRVGEPLDWESYSRLAELNVEAVSEYLLARVERGELEKEKLELAAYCGEAGARSALGCETARRQPADLEEWIEDLLPHGRWALALASGAIAWASSMTQSQVKQVQALLREVLGFMVSGAPEKLQSLRAEYEGRIPRRSENWEREHYCLALQCMMLERALEVPGSSWDSQNYSLMSHVVRAGSYASDFLCNGDDHLLARVETALIRISLDCFASNECMGRPSGKLPATQSSHIPPKSSRGARLGGGETSTPLHRFQCNDFGEEHSA